MNLTLQKILTHCTENERKEEIEIDVFVKDLENETREIIEFHLSDIIFNQDTGIIEDCKINGVAAPANIKSLNVLITEDLTLWEKCNGNISVDLEVICPSLEYLKDLYFFKKMTRSFYYNV